MRTLSDLFGDTVILRSIRCSLLDPNNNPGSNVDGSGFVVDPSPFAPNFVQGSFINKKSCFTKDKFTKLGNNKLNSICAIFFQVLPKLRWSRDSLFFARQFTKVLEGSIRPVHMAFDATWVQPTVKAYRPLESILIGANCQGENLAAR